MAGSCLWEKIEKKNRFSLCHPQATHECPQKMAVHSVQPLGRLYATYLFYRFKFYLITIFFLKKHTLPVLREKKN